MQQEVAIEVQRVRHTDAGFVIPIAWHATGRARLSPSFDGELALSGDALHTEMALRGTYTVPLGPLGGFGDGLAGRRLARRSLTSFLEQVARRLDTEVDRRADSVAWHPAPYPVAVHDRDVRSEQFIG